MMERNGKAPVTGVQIGLKGFQWQHSKQHPKKF